MMPCTAFGDWHGSPSFAVQAIASVQQSRPAARLVHVGDFGLWPGPRGSEYLDSVDRVLTRPLYVVPGNHEYWPELRLGSRVFGFTELDDDGFLYTPAWENIRVCPRTNVWTWGGTVFAALAGAASIDFELRTQGRSWWPEELPTVEHIEQLAAEVGGRDVAVFITHDAPADAIATLGLYPVGRKTGWSARALAYAQGSADTIAAARARLRPRLHVAGHHHVRRSCVVDGTQVELLSDDGAGSLAGNRLDMDAWVA